MARRWQMLNAHRALLVGYGFAATAARLAFWLTRPLRPLLKPSVSPLFFAAVMVSAWYGGLGTGLLAAALAVGTIDYFFLPPPSARVIALDEFLRLSVFVLVA